MFWTFKFSFDVDILIFFKFGNCFGYFFQKVGQFFQIIWSHCLELLDLMYGFNFCEFAIKWNI